MKNFSKFRSFTRSIAVLILVNLILSSLSFIHYLSYLCKSYMKTKAIWLCFICSQSPWPRWWFLNQNTSSSLHPWQMFSTKKNFDRMNFPEEIFRYLSETFLMYFFAVMFSHVSVCPWGVSLSRRGSLSRESLSREISVQGDLCLEGISV